MSVSILHLTDLHLGPGELPLEDTKDRLEPVARQRVIDLLAQYVRALPHPPEYVAVTGDLTIQGNVQGFRDFREWIVPLIEEGALPEERRILVLPGNHDVDWSVPEDEKFAAFGRVACAFTHAWLPNFDPALDQSPICDEIRRARSGVLGGVRGRTIAGEFKIERSDPFLLDLDRGVLLFAFNSTLGSGTYTASDRRLLDELDQLSGLVEGDGVLQRKIVALKRSAEATLRTDAPLIGAEQLSYFADVVRCLSRSLGDRFRAMTKIALLHHHVSHLWRQPFELKRFEMVADAARFKRALMECGFDIVLHGHKHVNDVTLDASLISIRERRAFNPLAVVSGGTVGGYPSRQDRQTFKLVELESDTAPRVSATVWEFPIFETADPASEMAQATDPFQVPLGTRIPGIHDLRDLKLRLDADLLDRLGGEGGATTFDTEFKLPGDSELVSSRARYVFAAVVENRDRKLLHEVILADHQLGFRQFARVYWMLNDVRAYSSALEKPCRVVLLVGNLENTHFSRTAAKGEVARSIRRLSHMFAPAVRSGLLEVRTHAFTQEEINELSSGGENSLADGAG